MVKSFVSISDEDKENLFKKYGGAEDSELSDINNLKNKKLTGKLIGTDLKFNPDQFKVLFQFIEDYVNVCNDLNLSDEKYVGYISFLIKRSSDSTISLNRGAVFHGLKLNWNEYSNFITLMLDADFKKAADHVF